MNEHDVIIKNVKREFFDALCEELKGTRSKFWPAVIVLYNGTNRYGTVTVSFSAGKIKERKEFMKIIAEKYAEFE